MATWEDLSYESQQKHTALKSGNMFPLTFREKKKDTTKN